MGRAVFVVAVAIAAALAGCSSPFDDAACTLESRSYPIEVIRDVPFPFAEAGKLKVEACATREGQPPTCTVLPATASGERFAIGSSVDAAEGALTKREDDGTRLLLTVHLGEGEPETTTLLRVRVLDDADREIVKAEGSVRWSSEKCHPTPSASMI